MENRWFSSKKPPFIGDFPASVCLHPGKALGIQHVQCSHQLPWRLPFHPGWCPTLATLAWVETVPKHLHFSFGRFLKSGIPKSPWISILTRSSMTWTICCYPHDIGNLQVEGVLKHVLLDPPHMSNNFTDRLPLSLHRNSFSIPSGPPVIKHGNGQSPHL